MTRCSKVVGLSLVIAMLVGGCRSAPERDELVLSAWLLRTQRVAAD